MVVSLNSRLESNTEEEEEEAYSIAFGRDRIAYGRVMYSAEKGVRPDVARS